MTRRSILSKWFVGFLLASGIAWIAGPFLLDSILVRVYDAELQAITLKPNSHIRWHSEGSGHTLIGPHGAPGWQPSDAPRRIIWWGDSQLEGFCVDDHQKICNLISTHESTANHPIDCINCGFSGTSSIDWQDRMDAADRLWQPEFHVWLITELSDLDSLVSLNRFKARQPSSVAIKTLAAMHGESPFHAVRNIVIDRSTGNPRSWRWTIGSGAEPDKSDINPNTSSTNSNANKLDAIASALQKIDQRLVLAYAPTIPAIYNLDNPIDPYHKEFQYLSEQLATTSIELLDISPHFIQLYTTQRRLPHGFDNSIPGLGHLNEFGNQIIADVFSDWLNGKQ